MAQRKTHLLVIAAITVALFALPVLAAGPQYLPGPYYKIIPLGPSAASSLATSSVATVAHWSNSFTFAGAKYPYTMVGTSPFVGPGTTTVGTIILPLKVVFADGVVIDGTTRAAPLVNSPIFKSAVFPSGVGQFADVIQQANFHRPISNHGNNYHVLLGAPQVLSTLTLHVPASSGFTTTVNGATVGLVDINYLIAALNNVLASQSFNPAKFLFVLVGDVYEYINTPSNCCVGGFHSATPNGAGQVLTFTYTPYSTPGIFSGGVSDITITSHEVAEWMNDPLTGNVVPPWGFPGKHPSTSSCASDLLEVGDPLEVFNPSVFPVTRNGIVYHPQDIAFFSWFAHQVPSIGLNQQYSYITPPKLTSPPPPCK